MACPLVAGLCVLMKAHTPSLTPTQLETCLQQSADNISALNPSYLGQLGAGRINALAALNCQACNAVASFTSTNNLISYPKTRTFVSPRTVRAIVLTGASTEQIIRAIAPAILFLLRAITTCAIMRLEILPVVPIHFVNRLLFMIPQALRFALLATAINGFLEQATCSIFLLTHH